MPSRNPQRDLQDLLLPRVARVDRLAGRELESRLATYGLTLAEFRLVGLLLGETAGLTQRELAERLGVRPPTISVLVAGLEGKRVVERAPDAKDARARRVRFAGGQKELLRVLSVVRELETEALEGIDPRKLEIAKQVMAQVSDNLSRAGEES